MPSPSIAWGSASNFSQECKARPIADWFARMEEEERGDGWLAWCRDRDHYVAWSEELIAAVARVLSRFSGIIVEVGAGRGELAGGLRGYGLDVIATDRSPGASDVVAWDARDALRHFRPATVVSSFLPLDAGVEASIMQFASVRRYLYIGPLVMGRAGPRHVWEAIGWDAEALPEVDRVLISRLDRLTNFTRSTHRQGAGAVLLERSE